MTRSERLLSLAEAWRIIGEHVRPGPTERVPLADALRRVLAERVTARHDYPPFDKAMMDGFAVRAVDTRGAPCELRVIGEVPAGAMPARPLGAGETMRINTGAPLPAGADAVVPVEETAACVSAESVRILNGRAPGRCVAPRSSVRAAGNVVLEPPVRLGAAQISALAAAGASDVTAYRVPTVGLVVTGNELVPPGSTPGPGQIVESNAATLAALTHMCGGKPMLIGIAPDEPTALRAALSRALDHPIVVAVGGMSKGTLDLVPEAFEQLGVRWHFRGVNLRPGKPTAYGTGPAGQQVFGLPGNPVSCLVCYLLFVQSALNALCGLRSGTPNMVRLRLEGDIEAGRDPRPAFLPVSVSQSGDPLVRLVVSQGSGDPIGVAAANAFLFQPRGDAAVESGAMVEVLPMPGMFG